ncbi:MAG: hypothetical protein AB1758_08380 [Candidatus Eremiobacterota bacterium]
MKPTRVLPLFLLLLLLACGSAPTSTSDSEGQEGGNAHKVTLEFGQAILAGDYAKAHGYLTSAARSRVSEADLKKQFEELTATYGKPSSVSADVGELPETAEEYDIVTTVPRDKWKGWEFAVFDNEIQAMVLVVDDGGTERIETVEFDKD